MERRRDLRYFGNKYNSSRHFSMRKMGSLPPSARFPPGGSRHPDGIFYQVVLHANVNKNGGDELPYLSDGGQALVGSIRAADDGVCVDLRSTPEGEGTINRVRSIPGGKFTGGVPPVPECYC